MTVGNQKYRTICDCLLMHSPHLQTAQTEQALSVSLSNTWVYGISYYQDQGPSTYSATDYWQWDTPKIKRANHRNPLSLLMKGTVHCSSLSRFTRFLEHRRLGPAIPTLRGEFPLLRGVVFQCTLENLNV